jgi:hypothetical protein
LQPWKEEDVDARDKPGHDGWRDHTPFIMS